MVKVTGFSRIATHSNALPLAITKKFFLTELIYKEYREYEKN
jgi:hypothetical protein